MKIGVGACYIGIVAFIVLAATTRAASANSKVEACISGDPTFGCPAYECDTIETFKRCPNVCENCGSCEDELDYCLDLVDAEYCHLHPKSTVQYCRKSCGAC